MQQRVLLGINDTLLAECLSKLVAEQYQVLLPERCDRLVREAEKLQPQLIILDDSLKDDPGSLCLTLRRRSPDSCLLYLSSNWQPSLTAQLEAHGVDSVLRKPFATHTLLSTIRRLLDATPC